MYDPDPCIVRAAQKTIYITNFVDPPAVSVHTEWLDVHYNIK